MGATVWPNGSVTIPRVSSEYSAARVGPDGVLRAHNGIDLIEFEVIKSPVGGVVTFCRYNGSAGNMVVVKEHGTNDTFVMMHNARFLTSLGARVAAGQDIAVMGTTGRSTGKHSHFETRPGDRYYENPRAYMAREITGAPASVGSGEVEITMDWNTFLGFMWRFEKYHSRDGGPDADGKLGATMWERVNAIIKVLADVRQVVSLSDESSRGGWFPFRNAMSRWLIYHSRQDGPEGKGATLHERLNQISAQIKDAGTVTVKIDADMLKEALSDPAVAAALAGPIAKAVNDETARRLVE